MFLGFFLLFVCFSQRLAAAPLGPQERRRASQNEHSDYPSGHSSTKLNFNNFVDPLEQLVVRQILKGFFIIFSIGRKICNVHIGHLLSLS